MSTKLCKLLVAMKQVFLEKGLVLESETWNWLSGIRDKSSGLLCRKAPLKR